MIDSETLKNLQNVEFQIMKDFDKYCRTHDIKYSIYSGTMLGAVRHKGFIPWDDDVDVAMTRTEYKKFCQTIKDDPMEGYFFENYETDKFCGTCHAKLRKLNTIFLQGSEIEGEGHHEIFIDIFPLDKLPNNKEAKKIEKIGREIVFITRANVKGSKKDSLLKKIVRNSVKIIPKSLRYKQLIKNVRYLEKIAETVKEDFCWVSMSTLDAIRHARYPQDSCDSYIELEFCGYKFLSFSKYHEMLTALYGDYMTPPPVEERVGKHKIIKLVF